jgi:hypothetical protein
MSTESDLEEMQRRTGQIYDLMNVALALIEDPSISYRTRKNLQTVITMARDINSETATGVHLELIVRSGRVP